MWVFHRRGGDPTRVSVRKVAAQTYLYSPFRSSGDRDYSVEQKLADLESLLGKLWPGLAEGFVDLGGSGVRKGLSLYLATQLLRHPYAYDVLKRSRRRLVKAVSRVPKDSDGYPAIESIVVGGREVPFPKEEWEAYADADENDEHWMFVESIESEAIMRAEMLMEKRWSMVLFDEPLLVTSDNPFFVIDPELRRDQIGGDHAKLIFPVSPTRLLCMDELDEPANQYYKPPPDAAGMYNYLTWVNTDGFLISPREIDGVLAGMHRVIEQYESECGGDDH